MYLSATDKTDDEAKSMQHAGNKNRQIKQAHTSADTELTLPQSRLFFKKATQYDERYDFGECWWILIRIC